MSSTFSGDLSWYYEAKRDIDTELRLGQITKEQYDKKIEMLWEERMQDSFY